MFPLWHSGIWRMGTNQQVKCWSGRSLIVFLRKRNIANTNLPLHMLTLNLHRDNLICWTVPCGSSLFLAASKGSGAHPALGRGRYSSGGPWPGLHCPGGHSSLKALMCWQRAHLIWSVSSFVSASTPALSPAVCSESVFQIGCVCSLHNVRWKRKACLAYYDFFFFFLLSVHLSVIVSLFCCWCSTLSSLSGIILVWHYRHCV